MASTTGVDAVHDALVVRGRAIRIDIRKARRAATIASTTSTVQPGERSDRAPIMLPPERGARPAALEHTQLVAYAPWSPQVRQDA